jgi:hypothetical protein
LRKVFQQVRGKEPVEATGLHLVRVLDLLDGQSTEAVSAAHGDRFGIVVDTDAGRVEVLEIAADTAPDVEDSAPAEETSQIPPIGSLDVEDPLPPRPTEP